MKVYGLYTILRINEDDLISTIMAKDIQEAIKLFAKNKKMNKDVMLDIFEVRELTPE
jgi:hypothetical protein